MPPIYIYLLFIPLLTSIVGKVQSQGSEECYGHGDKVDDHCVCDEGYDGDACQHCVHRFVLNETSGTVSNGPEAIHFSGCLAIIKPPYIPNSTLHLEFQMIGNLCCGDYLNIHDGDSVLDPPLLILNGDVNPASLPHLVSSTGMATLNFYDSDQPIQELGYEIYYSLVTPSTVEGSGEDVSNNIISECIIAWCWHKWPNMLTQGRASAAVASTNNSLFLYGGQMFGWPDRQIPFLQLDLETLEWSEVTTIGDVPIMRSDHTMVQYNNSLIVFGGKFTDGHITNEIWSFDLLSMQWTLLNITTSPETQVPSLIGHSAHVTTLGNDSYVMLVFFGYNQDWGVSNFVFQLDLVSHEWSYVKTTEYVPPGSYKHASAIDTESNLVYVHGGYNDEILQSLYVYYVEQKQWRRLAYSSSPRYLHSMALLSGSLYLYGGLSRDTDPSCGCVEVKPLRYNLECNAWQQVGDNPSLVSPRYGHSSAVLNSTIMVVVGGFTGNMLSDAVTFSVDKMSDECQVWNETSCDDVAGCDWSGSSCAESCPGDEALRCSDVCSSMTSCGDCYTAECSCCHSNQTNQCSYSNSTCEFDIDSCQAYDNGYYCSKFVDCNLCYLGGCMWENLACKPYNESSNSTESHCPDNSCDIYTDCYNCTSSTHRCSWCSTTGTCYKRDSAPIQFPYGTCFETITVRSQCTDDPCTEYESCDSCFKDARCGWCDLGSVTGVGLCMTGSLHASSNITDTCPNAQWHFENCVDCQCNGHSTCPAQEPDTCASCEDGTSGDDCGVCAPLWYGDPVNGGNCTACGCNDHAFECSNTGFCYCYQTGVVGRNCEACQTSANYNGDAVNDTCFYSMRIMTEYTFSLNSQWGYDSTQINFEVCPPHQADVWVKLNLPNNTINHTSVIIAINTTRSDTANETILFHSHNVTTAATYKIRQSDVYFGGSTCVRIYVANVEAKGRLQISIIQYLANIWMIVLIFVSCFLGLLITAIIVWKINDLFLRRRRRARRAVELERMAARPIAAVHFDTDTNDKLTNEELKKSRENGGLITEEICSCAEAAVYTVLLSLPTSEDSTFSGCSVALGTSLGTKLRFDFNAASAEDEKYKSSKFGWKVFRTRRRPQNRSFDNPVMNMNADI